MNVSNTVIGVAIFATFGALASALEATVPVTSAPDALARRLAGDRDRADPRRAMVSRHQAGLKRIRRT